LEIAVNAHRVGTSRHRKSAAAFCERKIPDLRLDLTQDREMRESNETMTTKLDTLLK
jgi:hypothetical protein